MNTALSLPNIRLVSKHRFAELYENTITGQRSVHAPVPFKQKAIISHFKGAAILKEPSRYTVQLSDDEHIILEPEYLQYINHSCSPNIFFDTSLLQLVALKGIEPGDELTFFYPSTEWEMAEPFLCVCGSGNCLHKIQGAKFLPPQVFSTYKVTSYIGNKYNEENR